MFCSLGMINEEGGEDVGSEDCSGLKGGEGMVREEEHTTHLNDLNTPYRWTWTRIFTGINQPKVHGLGGGIPG